MIIKEFPPLYTLDSKKKIRVFTCRVSVLHTVHIVTATGLLDGKLIEKTETVKIGKQKRTVEEQAIFQANSLWLGKQDEGYKSEKQLVIAMTSKGVDTPVGIVPLIIHCNHHIPNWYVTNSNFDELPMLAHKFKDIKNPVYPYIAQPKLDGVRCLIKIEQINTNLSNLDSFQQHRIKLISRGGQYYQISHLNKQIAEIFYFLFVNYNHTDFILDGEIYKHGTPLQEISGAARKEETGMFASNFWLEYHIYDVIDITKNLKQSERSELLKDLRDKSTEYVNNIKFVKSDIVHNRKEVQQLHDNYVSQGYEGLILRDGDGKYEFNQRSKSLLKMKAYQDEEFVIMGAHIDDNKSIEESFVFELKNNINDLRFNARPTGTGEMKKQWYESIEQYIGKKATVRFFARSNDGLPTQGVVRSKDSMILMQHIRPDGE
jgi:hypothetical protein